MWMVSTETSLFFWVASHNLPEQVYSPDKCFHSTLYSSLGDSCLICNSLDLGHSLQNISYMRARPCLSFLKSHSTHIYWASTICQAICTKLLISISLIPRRVPDTGECWVNCFEGINRWIKFILMPRCIGHLRPYLHLTDSNTFWKQVG